MASKTQLKAVETSAHPAAEWVHIDPALAIKMLEKNVNNRPVSDRQVAEIADIMRAGRFDWHPATIVFNESGELDDGQHRLWAIIQAGVTVPLLVVKGSSRELRALIDSGMKRAVQHQVRMTSGQQATVTTAAAANRALRYLKFPALVWTSAQTRPSRMEVIDFSIQHHDLLVESVKMGDKMRHALPRSRGVIHAFAFLGMYLPKDKEFVPEFLESMASGAGLTEGDPRLTLRNSSFMTVDKAGSEWDQQKRLAYLIKAVNKHHKGQTAKTLGQFTRDNLPMPQFEF